MSKASSWPLLLIAVALVGAGFSYHYTLDARFATLEQKLEQNTIALQQYQVAQETATTAKAATLDKLNKEVDSLQASLTPLGQATKAQTDSLAQIREQISSLGQLQQAQQDANKKLADYAGQLEKMKHDVQQQHEAQASSPGLIGPVPPTVPLPTSTPVQVPVPAAPPATAAPAPTVHASIAPVKSLVTPLTETSTVDLRPADITAPRVNAVRALPVALPVDASLSDNR